MIHEQKQLSLVEVKNIVEKLEEKKDISAYLKKFGKINLKQAEKIRKELEALDNLKIKSEDIVKIIDLLPEDASDVNKIFTDVNLTEDEINKILEIVKNK